MNSPRESLNLNNFLAPIENSRDISCSKHLVAVIDILGSEDLILNSNQNDSLRDLHFISDFTLQIQNEGKDYKIKIFSDNIIIAKCIHTISSEDISNHIHDIFMFVSDYQWHLLNLGYLSRGGVSIGDLYIDNTIVWGKALVEAHELEARKAIYPRVIISDYILSIYKKPENRTSRVMQDDDGKFFIDYLTYNLECELTIFPYILDMIKYKSSKIKDTHIKSKYDWYENYHQKVYTNYDIEEWKKRWGKRLKS